LRADGYCQAGQAPPLRVYNGPKYVVAYMARGRNHARKCAIRAGILRTLAAGKCPPEHQAGAVKEGGSCRRTREILTLSTTRQAV
jgi:hypothetical protein